MERRTATAIALSVAATVVAVGAAFAANVGLLADDTDPVGQLQIADVSDLVPTETTPVTPQTIIIDVPVAADGSTANTADAATTANAADGSAPTSVTTADDRGGSEHADDDGQDDDGHDDELEDHEGADDDD